MSQIPTTYTGFPGGSDSKESACNAVNPSSIPDSGRSLEKEMVINFSIFAVESYGQRSLAGYSPWGHKESNTTEQLTLSFFIYIYVVLLPRSLILRVFQIGIVSFFRKRIFTSQEPC